MLARAHTLGLTFCTILLAELEHLINEWWDLDTRRESCVVWNLPIESGDTDMQVGQVCTVGSQRHMSGKVCVASQD